MFWKKKNKLEFSCKECGEIHDNWPALTLTSPHNYHLLSEKEKATMAEIDTDFCTISYKDQTDRFIRVVLSQKVLDSEETLDYGLWVSLSEKSYRDYKENYNNDHHEKQYFGWLCNEIPGYKETMSIPTTVVTQKANQRPKIYPHKDFNHKFVHDFYNGITSHEAQARVDRMLDNR